MPQVRKPHHRVGRQRDIRLPECDEAIEIGVFDGAFTPQPDCETCGWATAMWLLKSFRCRIPSAGTLEKELHLRKSSFPDGTWPQSFRRAMERRNLILVESRGPVKVRSHIRDPFVANDPGMRDLFRRNGRAAVCFACVAPFVQGGTWAHCVGIERHEGKVRVMDPLYASGYCPLAK